ncbi:F0F1 ATP synthase subunit A [Oscillospiraceae bacterium NTUH-002-81]|nr:F0F1 ATP synthase subunit A [Oscillospiraceae bacterium NTUH-002-81]
MGDLASRIMEELTCKTAFTIPVFGGIPIAESVAVSWIIMGVLVVLSIVLTRHLRVTEPTRRQVALETAVTGLEHIFDGILGEKGRRYVPYMVTVLLYIGVSNIIGLFGLKPPTKDLNVTAALALMSIILVETSGIRSKGLKGWLKSFADPSPVIAPMNLLEVIIRPLSLCMRLFGNVLGAFVIMELIKQLLPVALPVPFSLYFDIFDGLLQAYVFTFLTSMFIQEKIN